MSWSYERFRPKTVKVSKTAFLPINNYHSEGDRTYMERRKLPRIDVDAPLQVCILGEVRIHGGRIVNVSQGGLRFTSAVSFPVGEILQFDLADHILVGTVRYSVAEKTLFATGIELQNAISKPESEFDALLQELSTEFVLD